MILTYYCIITMIIIAYLLGSIPSAVWIGKKYYGIDIREHGSRNAGTTNMLRVLGRRAALPASRRRCAWPACAAGCRR